MKIQIDLSKLIIGVLVAVIAVFVFLFVSDIVSWNGLIPKDKGQVKLVVEPNKPSDANALADSNQPTERREFSRRGPGGRFGGIRFDPNDPNLFTVERIARIKEIEPKYDPNTYDPNDPNSVTELRGIFAQMGPGPGGRSERITDANEVSDPNDPNSLESLNLKNVAMSEIFKKISDWTGAIVIPGNEEIMKQKITIYSSEKIPRSLALIMIYSALKTQGSIAVKEREFEVEGKKVIELVPLEEVKLGIIPTVFIDAQLSEFEDKTKIVQKFFKLESFLASQMAQILQPLIGKYGHINADDNTKILLVIETIDKLIGIESIIKQFDVPEAKEEETIVEVFEIKYGDPGKITQDLNQLLTGEGGIGSFSSSSSRSRSSSSSSYRGPFGSSRGPSRPGTTLAGLSEGPIILIPNQERKWIIARASEKDMELIREWIKRFDVEEKFDPEEVIESDWESVDLKYASASEVENAIDNNLRDRPIEQRPFLQIEALEQSRKVVITGSKKTREWAKVLIKEIDVPKPVVPSRTWKLKYLDVEELQQFLEEAYPISGTSGRSGYSPFNPYSSRSRSSQVSSTDEVNISVFTSRNEITVRAMQSTLEQINEIIQELDQPIKWDPPRIVELENTDPVQMTSMLNNLFDSGSMGGGSSRGGRSILDMLFGGSSSTTIGQLSGKVNFIEVPGAKKILVISKIPEKYNEVVAFIEELDRAKLAEMPRVIQLKYANPWDVSELLNALFNEPGTTASIQRVETGLEYIITQEDTSTSGGQQTGQQQQQSNSAEYRPPWSGTGARSGIGQEMPISNVIGKVRFLPESRSKSVLVLAPSELMEGIEKLINDLDKPGKQVMVRAIVVEVDRIKLDSIGVQIASDPGSLSLGENSIRALSEITHQKSSGSVAFGSSGTPGSTFNSGLGVDINVLIDFLVRKTDGKVVNEQTLYTEDYKNAEFFKGEEVSLLGASTVSGGVGTITQSIRQEEVGMTLRVRPNITPEKNVEMEVDLSISQLSQDTVNGQPKIVKARATNTMMVKDGHTVLLASIHTSGDESVNRKIPIFGDLPLVGGVFRHKSTLKSDSKMLVFITPTVVDEDSDPKEVKEIKEAIDEMDSVLNHLEEMGKWLETAN